MKNIKEEKKKRKLKWYIKLILLIVLIVLYARFVGTNGIFVKEYKISSTKIENEFHGLKIAHFSDLHYGSTINQKDIKELVIRLNKTKPDIIIFTGDLIDKKYKITEEEITFLKNQLSKINAELGKYYVIGEDDYEQSINILDYANFVNLNDAEQLIYRSNKEPILIIGKDKVQTYFENNEITPSFKILAIHNPNDYTEYKDYKFNVVLSGHTHNGQINIPKIKDIFINSKYNKPYQKNDNTKIFVNSGIGTSGVKMRLFNHPVINLYRLNKTSTK